MTHELEEVRLHCQQNHACNRPPETCGCRCVDCTEAHLTEIAWWFDELQADLIPGTARRWYQRDLTVDEIVQRDDRDHQERLARFGANSRLPDHLRPTVTTPLGESPAPARTDVLDVIADVTFTIVDLRDRIAATFNAGRRLLAVDEACRWMISTLRTLDVALYARVAEEARRMVGSIRAATGQLDGVIRLDAACPICAQRTVHALAVRMTVVCRSDECRGESSWPAVRFALLLGVDQPAEEAS